MKLIIALVVLVLCQLQLSIANEAFDNGANYWDNTGNTVHSTMPKKSTIKFIPWDGTGTGVTDTDTSSTAISWTDSDQTTTARPTGTGTGSHSHQSGTGTGSESSRSSSTISGTDYSASAISGAFNDRNKGFTIYK